MSDGYRYACCEHCEEDGPGDDEHGFHIDGHLSPCPHGCNDGEGAA